MQLILSMVHKTRTRTRAHKTNHEHTRTHTQREGDTDTNRMDVDIFAETSKFGVNTINLNLQHWSWLRQ